MKPKKVKAEDCVNGNCEICEAAGYGLDHKLMSAFTSGGLPGVRAARRGGGDPTAQGEKGRPMNNDGYPTDAELKKIQKWPPDDLHGLLEYVQKRWQYADAGYWKQRGSRFWVSTAGWSGNESIIGALQQNYVFWSFCWLQSRRGGHYIFQLRKEKKK